MTDQTISDGAERRGKREVAKNANALERLRVEYVPVHDLRPNTYNPNRQSDHDFELLMRSMREDGFTQPIVALRDGQIVDGEHRWRAGQALGMPEVPVVFVDMTPEQMRVATLRHNRARGSEDVELAAQVLRDLAALGALDHAADSLMLDDVEMQRLMDDIGAPEALAADEFSAAWEPTEKVAGEGGGQADESAAATSTSGTVTAAPGGGTQVAAASAAAIEAQREQQRQLAAAKSEEERQTIRREAAAFFRVVLLFQGEEADLVRGVLGERQAETLLAMCRERLAATGGAEDAGDAG